MKVLLKIVASIGSIISISFGIWHFFVPAIWDWYSYIDKTATELIMAVRAINIFFSLSLVLLGIANLFVVFKMPRERFSLVVLLSVSVILWATRFVLQIIYPQGSQNPVLQFSMLLIFLLVLACYIITLWLVLIRK